MTILLQHTDTREYLRRDEGWTDERAQAREFKSGHEAVLFCAERELTHVQVLYDFPDRRMNFAQPLSDAYLGMLHRRLARQAAKHHSRPH